LVDHHNPATLGPVLIWKRPLAEGEVKALFSASIVPKDGLVAWFAHEGSGTIIHDKVGGKVGKIHGAAWQRQGTGGHGHSITWRRMLNRNLRLGNSQFGSCSTANDEEGVGTLPPQSQSTGVWAGSAGQVTTDAVWPKLECIGMRTSSADVFAPVLCPISELKQRSDAKFSIG
jgi:hypothetical protein